MTFAFFQASSIFRYSVILFCFFLAAARLSGLMFSSPMKTRRTPARAAFSMKFGSRWQSVSTWMMRREVDAVALVYLDQPVEDFLPVLVAGEIVVGDEETADSVRQRCARTIRSTSSAERRRDFRPCTLMMVQKEHWYGQPRPASKLVLAP